MSFAQPSDGSIWDNQPDWLCDRLLDVECFVRSDLQFRLALKSALSPSGRIFGISRRTASLPSIKCLPVACTATYLLCRVKCIAWRLAAAALSDVAVRAWHIMSCLIVRPIHVSCDGIDTHCIVFQQASTKGLNFHRIP